MVQLESGFNATKTDQQRHQFSSVFPFMSSPFEFTTDPGSGIDPVSVGSFGRNSQNLSRLISSQARKIPQLDQPGFDWVVFGQLAQGDVEVKQIVLALRGCDNIWKEFLAMECATMDHPLPTAGSLDQDPSHGGGRSGKEVSAVFPRLLAISITDQPQPGLMYQRSVCPGFSPASFAAASFRNSS
jgi:hypothetical protein